jgi:hypothetical protein
MAALIELVLEIVLQIPEALMITVSPHAVTKPFRGLAGPGWNGPSALRSTPMRTVPGLISGCAGGSGRITWRCNPCRRSPVQASLGDDAQAGSQPSRPNCPEEPAW